MNNDGLFKSGSLGFRKLCENCDAPHAKLYYRLNPTNWAPNEKLLCAKCASKLRFTAKDFGRTPFTTYDAGRKGVAA